MTYREIRFIGLAVILLAIPIIGIVYLLPSNSYEEVEYKSEKSKRMKAPFGHPDKFAEYFAAAKGVDIGYEPYPQGYQFTELRKAKQANAKRGQMTQLDWIERGPGRTGGRTRAILVDYRDPTFNTFYVGTVGGGVWKASRYINTFDQEAIDWIPLTDDLPSLAVSAMAGASKNHPDVIYVGTGEGFYNIDASSGIGMFKTIDGGHTWTHLSATINNPDWRYVNRIIVDPDNPDIVIVATNSKLFRSENGGESFSVVFPVLDFDFDFELELRFEDLRAKPDDFNVQFATINNSGIIKSIDRGKTWDFKLSRFSLSSFIYGGGRIELGISQSHPEVVWASVESSGLRQTDNSVIDDLYRSSDAGETWNFVENLETVPDWHKSFLGGQGWYDNAIAVHPFSPDTVFLGGVIRRKAWIEGDETFNIVSGKLENNANFLTLTAYSDQVGHQFRAK